MGTIVAGILAGGFGTRLRSVLADRPKALALVHGRPFLAYLLDQLVSAGVNTAVLCTGYLGDQVTAAFGDTYRGMRLVYSQESAPRGTAGALRGAIHLLPFDPVLVMNGDSFCELDLEPLCHFHTSRDAAATIVLTRVKDTTRYGRVNTDSASRIVRFEEKSATCAPGWISAGVYLLSRRLLLTIPPNETVSLERQVFTSWIHRGLFGYRSPGRFLDIGTPESYAAADCFFRGRNTTPAENRADHYDVTR
jgi:NDP-sugar pyrophosphorylase family protein